MIAVAGAVLAFIATMILQILVVGVSLYIIFFVVLPALTYVHNRAKSFFRRSHME